MGSQMLAYMTMVGMEWNGAIVKVGGHLSWMEMAWLFVTHHI